MSSPAIRRLAAAFVIVVALLAEFFTMGAGGSQRTPRTATRRATASPYGRPKAGCRLQRRPVGRLRVYVAEAAGGAPLRLTHWLAFESSRTGNADVFLMRPDGSDERNVTEHPAADLNPLWSPGGQRHGRQIAFASNRDGDFEIFSMRANGKRVAQLTRNSATDSIPDWQRPPRPETSEAR